MTEKKDEKFYHTFSIIKPDAMKYKDEIIKMIEDNGFKVMYAKCEYLTKEKVEEHYAHCKDLDVFPKIVESMIEGPVMLMIIYDPKGNAIDGFRKLQGKTKSWEAEEGTIRYQFGSKSKAYKNATHASASPVEVKDEILRFFKNDIEDILEKINDYNRLDEMFANAYKFIDSMTVIEKAEEEYKLRKKYNGEK